MRFHYCPDCGSALVLRPIGDEGDTPYCENCRRPLFDMFSTCIIALVVNDRGEAALLRQGYISDRYYNLVSGYMKPGESAEECARREIGEELGLRVTALESAGTFWFAKRDMLMIGFFACTDQTGLSLSREVDSARWVPVEDALSMVHPRGSVSYTMIERYLQKIT